MNKLSYYLFLLVLFLNECYSDIFDCDRKNMQEISHRINNLEIHEKSIRYALVKQFSLIIFIFIFAFSLFFINVCHTNRMKRLVSSKVLDYNYDDYEHRKLR